MAPIIFQFLYLTVVDLTCSTDPLCRFEVADKLKMDYTANSELVDDICKGLPSREFPDDGNPYRMKMRARGEHLYHLMKLDMSIWKTDSSFSQTLVSNVTKNDKKNWASIEGNKDSAITTNKTDAALLFQEKLKVLESAEPRVAALVKDLKIIKAKFSVIVGSEGPGLSFCLKV
jgi:hypothetical protein